MLPKISDTLPEAREERRQALAKVDPKILFGIGGLEDPGVSHTLIKYVVPTEGEDAFFKWSLDVITLDILEQMEEKLSTTSLADMVTILIRNDETPSHMPEICPKIFETAVSLLLTSPRGVVWKRYPDSTFI